MIKDVVIPEIGEKIESGDVVNVMVKPGDTVQQDDPILEFETDKAVVEIPAPSSGQIVEILVESGQTIKVGAVIARIDSDVEPEAAALSTGAKDADESVAKKASPASEPKQADTSEADTSESTLEAVDGEGKQTGEEPVASASIPVKAADGGQSETAVPDRKTSVGPPLGDIAPASPSVRRLARELGVNIDDVIGSGAGGRIAPEDVKAHVRRLVSGGGAPARSRASQVTSGPLPDFGKWGEIQREQMSRVRSLTAESMAAAWSTVPHVTQFDKADITDIESFRKKYGEKVESRGGKLTVTAVLLKVLGNALQRFPKFNASIDVAAGEIIYKKYINVGMAVDTDRGLLVPVLRDIDKKSIAELAVEVTDLARRTRDKKITPDDLEGGTFTVSNQGSIGGTDFTPIVYWPQVAILGVSRSSQQPVYIDGDLRPRSILPLSLSYDHRIIDGAEASRFLDWVARALEQPFVMSLD